MKHKAGGKITSSHSTLIKAASKLVSFLEKQCEVKKISLGVIKTFPGGRQNKQTVIKIVNEINCIRIGVTEGSSHQTLRFYFANDLAEIEKEALLRRVGEWIKSNKWIVKISD